MKDAEDYCLKINFDIVLHAILKKNVNSSVKISFVSKFDVFIQKTICSNYFCSVIVEENVGISKTIKINSTNPQLNFFESLISRLRKLNG